MTRFRRKFLDRLGIERQYFIAGHNRWFVFIMSVTNFIILVFNFVWLNLEAIPEPLQNFFVFYMFFTLFYVIVARNLGYLDLTRGTFKAETNVSLKVNPIWKRHFQELREIKTDIEALKKQLTEIFGVDF